MKSCKFSFGVGMMRSKREKWQPASLHEYEKEGCGPNKENRRTYYRYLLWS